jgi:hypothetical protein
MKILIASLFLASGVRAAPEHAVVRIPSHGGSGTVIATGEGWSLVLSCWHCFKGETPASHRPIALDVPVPQPGSAKNVGVKLVALGDAEVDLALLRVPYGPLPYVAPVGPPDMRPGACWSVGYDDMRLPARVRPARVAGSAGRWGEITLTYERPWHGRSGGALIDQGTGYLVGVVSAYEGPSNRAERHPPFHGVYVSHRAILRFLRHHGYLRDADEPAAPRHRPFGMPAPGC